MNNYVLIKVGNKPNLFLKKIVNMGINYSNLVKGNKNIILKLKYDDYLKLSKYYKMYNIDVLKYYGYIYLKQSLTNNIHVLIGFIISLIIVILLSKLTFNITINHNSNEIKDAIYEYLNSNGIKKIHLLPSYNKIKNIKKDILINNKNIIEWIEIEKKGTNIIINVIERKITKKTKTIKPRNIVAKKNGIIKKIICNQGEIIKKTNDYVNSGDIIISGNIIKDEEIKQTIPANGKVYAEVWYEVNVKYPLQYKELLFTNKERFNIDINFLNNKYSLRKNLYTKYHKNHLIKIDRLGIIKYFMGNMQEVKYVNQKISLNKAKEKAIILATKKIKKQLTNDEYIISKKTLKFYDKGSKIDVDIFFKVYEDITDYKNIE